MNSSPVPKLVHIATFGCQMNEYDSARLEGLLASHGFSPTADPQAADLILVNTCSVRERAESKVYSLLGSLKELKKRRPRLIIGVGGCVAQQEGQKLLDHIPHLDLVFGTGALERVPELVEEARQGRRRALVEQAAGLPSARPAAGGRLKAMVTVMTGCDNFCSYCVVPYVRGREKSRPAGDILEEVAALAGQGVREVTLLGQNVNSYRDAGQGLGFPGLLERVAQTPGLWRVRFTTSHPKDLSPALMEALAGIEQVMEQLQMPAQSGSDRVLKAMGRGYTRAQYLAKVHELRGLIPQLALGGDIIVGFPGESEAEFTESLSLLKEVGYDSLFSFKYSDRPFTQASALEGKLADQVKSQRLNRLQALQRDISLARHQALAGQVAQVLVEGPAKRGEGLMCGRDRGGRMVNFPAGPQLKGSLALVRISEGRINSLKGRLHEPAQGA